MQTENFEQLQEFVEAAKSKGASDESLAALLMRRGWPANDVYGTLAGYWQRATGISIPDRGSAGESSRDAFLYLLSFSMLATWATSLGALLFDLIDHWIPDLVSRGNTFDIRTTLTWAMARIAIAFPVYLFVTALTLKETTKQPERLQSGVRKWLTYLALLGTASTMICDLVWFLDYLLMGEITLRFVLKSATVMVLCAGIFTYYLSSLKWKSAANVSGARVRNSIFALVASITVVAGFCVGLSVAGSPSQQRSIEADRIRVEDLHAIADAVKMWHDRALLQNANATVPANLGVLVQAGELSARLAADPETHAPYGYFPQNANRYELCGNFASSDAGQRMPAMHSGFWHHGRGKTCFVVDASATTPW